MPVLSSVRHLFNVAQCHAYIHTLRWQDRPLQCPRCQSQDVDPWGTYHYRPGCKRYWCHGCQRTFNDLTNTLLHQSKRSLTSWIRATFLLCLSCSSRRITRELGLHISTSDRWCWWLRNTALPYETDRQLVGTVEADDLYQTAGNKGQAHGGARSRWSGEHVAGARNVSPAGAIMTRTGLRLLRGSVARGQSSSRRPVISPSRRCKRQRTSPCKRGPTLYGFSEQLSGGEGLRARVRQSYEEGVCTRGGP
jgi:transposase-like protein